MSSFRISDKAVIDLDSIWDYIALQSIKSADRMIDRIVAKFSMLAHHSLMGEAREELQRGLRCFTVGNYVIYYRPHDSKEETVEIVRVLHGARDVHRIYW